MLQCHRWCHCSLSYVSSLDCHMWQREKKSNSPAFLLLAFWRDAIQQWCNKTQLSSLFSSGSLYDVRRGITTYCDLTSSFLVAIIWCFPWTVTRQRSVSPLGLPINDMVPWWTSGLPSVSQLSKDTMLLSRYISCYTSFLFAHSFWRFHPRLGRRIALETPSDDGRRYTEEQTAALITRKYY